MQVVYLVPTTTLTEKNVHNRSMTVDTSFVKNKINMLVQSQRYSQLLKIIQDVYQQLKVLLHNQYLCLMLRRKCFLLYHRHEQRDNKRTGNFDYNIVYDNGILHNSTSSGQSVMRRQSMPTFSTLTLCTTTLYGSSGQEVRVVLPRSLHNPDSLLYKALFSKSENTSYIFCVQVIFTLFKRVLQNVSLYVTHLQS